MQADILNFPTPSTPSKATSEAPQSRKAPVTRSSWIEAVRYHDGFLVAFTRGKHGKPGGAFIFYGVEPEICGLVLAGTGGKSVGHALHRLLREVKADGSLGDWKYTYQYIKADEKDAPSKPGQEIEWFQGPRKIRRTGYVLSLHIDGSLSVRQDTGRVCRVLKSANPQLTVSKVEELRRMMK